MTYDPHDYEELCGKIHSIFNSEPAIGSEGEEWYEMPPLERLSSLYGLDTSYWRPFEFGSSSPLMRRSAASDDDVAAIVRAQQVPRELFMGTFRLLGDSIIEYYGKEPRDGPFHFYPAILMSACASFEAFVRIYSKLLVKTSRGLPRALEVTLKQGGLLDRYWLLLKFGYGCEYDRKSEIWRMGKSAIDKRNELVHYEFSGMPSLKTTELWQHLEALLLMLIGPSSQIGKSIVPDQYELYGLLDALRPLIEDFEEKPFFKGLGSLRLQAVVFPCSFENVDDGKFPRSFLATKHLGGG